MFEHLTVGPWSSAEEFTAKIIDGWVQPDPHIIVFAVYDLTRTPVLPERADAVAAYPPSSCFAGIFGLTRTEPEQLHTELGWALIFPPFQRSHVTAHAIGLLLDYCLALPTSTVPPLFVHDVDGDGPRGLGLRRVAWTTIPANAASVRAAARMGFKHEGVRRWVLLFPSHFQGNPLFKTPRAGDPREDCPGQDVVMMSMCWDDWENGGRDHARAMMQR